MYSSGDIVLINFPFTDLIGSKVRPALVIAEKKEDIIVIGIFSKVPDPMEESWILLNKEAEWFAQTGLKKSSVIKTEKLVVIHCSIVKKKLGNLSSLIFSDVQKKLKETLDL